jgi:hypothetical protein
MVPWLKKFRIDAAEQQRRQIRATAGETRDSISIGVGKQNSPSSTAHPAICRRATRSA